MDENLVYTDDELKKICNVFGEMKNIKNLDDFEQLVEAVNNFDPVLNEYLSEFLKLFSNSQNISDKEASYELGRKIGKHIIERISDNMLEDVIKKEPTIASFFVNEWVDFDEEKQQKYLFRVIESLPPSVIWTNAKKSVQLNNISELLKKYERNTNIFINVWANSDKEVQKSIVDELFNTYEEEYENEDNTTEIRTPFGFRISDNKVKLSEVWLGLNNELKKEYFDIFLKKYRDNNYNVMDFWCYTPPEIQRLHINVFEEELDNKGYTYMFSKTDGEVLFKCFPKIFEKETGTEITPIISERIKALYEKNHSICKLVAVDLLKNDDIFNDYDEEKIIRMTNYPGVQFFMLDAYKTPAMKKMVKDIINNDENWIISIDKIMKNDDTYHDLKHGLRKCPEEVITDEFVQQLADLLMDSQDYFGMMKDDELDEWFLRLNEIYEKGYIDIGNYFSKKNEVCLNILKNDLDKIDGNLLTKLQDKVVHNKGDLYKFALLEYKFGISLEEAKRLIQRYGKDTEELPECDIKEYLKVIKDVVECDNIEEVIDLAIQDNSLEQPWTGFPNSRNAEGKIINLFTELYNKTFYNPFDEKNKNDKSTEQAVYFMTNDDGTKKECKIDIYNIHEDFNMSVRVEGAYSKFEEPANFKDYYNLPNLLCHGNCQSYIGNDLIATARNQGGIMVAYSSIGKNGLTSLAPYDISSTNRFFSNFNEKSEYRIPKKEKDYTRHTHNEMVQERIVVDEKGNVTKLEPNYIVWIEESTIEQRNQVDWKTQRESDPKWIMSKKAAAQLGVPIVIIDREYFAQRELEKVNLIEKMILGENADKSTYSTEFEKLSKPELIKEAITKFENNVMGIQFNQELKKKYFTNEQALNLIQNIKNEIDKMSGNAKTECMQALADVAEKEARLSENDDVKEFCGGIEKEQRTKIAILENESVPQLNNDEIEELEVMVKGITNTPFYDKGTIHSIAHIQKVMLFSDILAKGENLSNEDRVLLLKAAALHDCAREGNDGNVPHAKKSAEKAGRFLHSDDKVFGTDDPNEIAIIKTAIHYHESDETTKGKVEYREIEKLLKKYNPDKELSESDIEKTTKICELLKDADALDRLRFADKGRLDREYLRTETAKGQLVINFAEEVNEQVALNRLTNIYGVKCKDVEPGHAVIALKKIQGPNMYLSRINETEYIEPKFSADDFMKIAKTANNSIQKNAKTLEDEGTHSKKTKKDLYMLYFKNGTTREDCEREQAKIKEIKIINDVKELSKS